MSDTIDTTEAEEVQTPEQLLVELSELHMRTLVSPLPKYPATMGWQMTTGAVAAGFARALHALREVAPEKAAEIADWYQGPFGDGPAPDEHTDWTAQTVAKSWDVMEQWAQEARKLAVQAKEATERHEQERQAAEVATLRAQLAERTQGIVDTDAEHERLRAQVEAVRAFATSHEYRWLHELLDGYGTHGGHL
ncbi:hypothetical protein [Streptomyces sp. NPDC015680]|uniref:hypothetical protein n=1 Tax=Streptomyces sp. NPDC015680 TaxID=3364962 RepID=UPI0037026C6E